jgi:hypothetical protein
VLVAYFPSSFLNCKIHNNFSIKRSQKSRKSSLFLFHALRGGCIVFVDCTHSYTHFTLFVYMALSGWLPRRTMHALLVMYCSSSFENNGPVTYSRIGNCFIQDWLISTFFPTLDIIWCVMGYNFSVLSYFKNTSQSWQLNYWWQKARQNLLLIIPL